MALAQSVSWPLVCLIVMTVQFVTILVLRARVRRLERSAEWYAAYVDQLDRQPSLRPLPWR